MDIFVKKDDKIEIPVFVFEDAEHNVDATSNQGEVPTDAQCQTIKFVFRRPNYEDSVNIARLANVGSEGQIDVISFQAEIMNSLCVDWDITDKTGIKVPINRQNKGNLQPAIARAAVTGCLTKIRI